MFGLGTAEIQPLSEIFLLSLLIADFFAKTVKDFFVFACFRIEWAILLSFVSPLIPTGIGEMHTPSAERFFDRIIKNSWKPHCLLEFPAENIFEKIFEMIEIWAKICYNDKKVNLRYDGDVMILTRIPYELKADIKQFRSSHSDAHKALFFSADPGMGKTYAALSYCTENQNSLYFSFRHISADLALKSFAERYPDIFNDCSDWASFFDCLRIYGKEKRPIVFFDDVGERNDKNEFYAALKDFLEEDSSCNIPIILIGRPWDQIEVPCKTTSIEPFSTQEIAETLSVSDKESVSIFSLTAGIPALLSLYDTGISSEENVKVVLHTGSPFYRLMISRMSECFRTPESYNTLLYAMVNGHNRISELAAFSGYPKNKCDKYIKSLCEFGLVQKEPEKNGHTKYHPANSYIALWYKTMLTVVPNADGNVGEEVYERFMRYFNDEILSAFYKEMCTYWLKENINSISTDYIDTKDLSYQNIRVGEVTFDFAYEKKRAVYAYYDTIPGGKLTQKLWKEIERVTTKDRPFYENEYVICTVNRVPDSYWTLSTNLDNVHIVQLKSLFTEYNKKYNRQKHPRFVPSFV